MEIGYFTKRADNLTSQYLTAYCNNEDISINYLDSNNDLESTIQNSRENILCMSAYKSNENIVKNFLELAKKYNKTPILGGPIVSIQRPVIEEILNNLFNINPELKIVYGTGTSGQILPQLINGLDNLEEVPQIIYFDKKIKTNRHLQKAHRIGISESLDLVHNIFGYNLSRYGASKRQKDSYNIFTGDGCTHNKCTFCAKNLFNYKDKISSEKLVELVSKSSHVRLISEDALLIKKELEDLAKINQENEIYLNLKLTTKGILQNPNLIAALARNYNLIINWGAENFNPRILKEMKKGSTQEELNLVPELITQIKKDSKKKIKLNFYSIDLWPNTTIPELKTQFEYYEELYKHNIYLVRSFGDLSKLVINIGSEIYDLYYKKNNQQSVPWVINWDLPDEITPILKYSDKIPKKRNLQIPMKDATRFKIDFWKEVLSKY